MSIDFILPDIGEGIVECEQVEWLVKEGDVIVEDQPIADVMTDKALVQIPAMHNGTVTKLYYAQGDIAKVHQPLFCMTTDEESSTNEVAPVVEVKNTAPAESLIVPTNNTGSALELEDFILPDIGEELSKAKNIAEKEEIIRNYSIKSERIHTLTQLLKAYTLFEKDIDYVVMEDKVKIFY